VRDLLLGRKPKDFDIGTARTHAKSSVSSWRCWIIGRRFRLALSVRHEDDQVATFRCKVVPTGRDGSDVVLDPRATRRAAAADLTPRGRSRSYDSSRQHVRHTEEDAFRRDFTVNALFYDIATFSIIDYVDGLRDIHERVIAVSAIGRRFREDPVPDAAHDRAGRTPRPRSTRRHQRRASSQRDGAVGPARLLEC
jgi:poly(A) polymerase